ncbi:MAG: hypothetical protein ACYTEL_11655, partial [Planctomycetota bacterium]
MVAPDVDLLRPDGTFPPEVLEGNLVLICSPKRNQLTKHILETVGLLKNPVFTSFLACLSCGLSPRGLSAGIDRKFTCH